MKQFKRDIDNEKLFTFVIYDESADVSVLAVKDSRERGSFSADVVVACHIIQDVSP